jgi:hypothetical protein
MAYSVLFVCDTCNGDIVLIHAQEWQADSRGQIQPYPGYGKIGGLVNQLWCPLCCMVRPHVIVRLDPPGDHPVIAYAEAQRLGATGAETGNCPECQTLLTWDAHNAPCPHCATGTLHHTGEWGD